MKSQTTNHCPQVAWDFMRRRPKINHVITLKIGEDCSDKDIAMLIAHEFRHYLQYLKHGHAMIGRESSTGKRKRPLQVERDANKWMNKRVAKLEARHLI